MIPLERLSRGPRPRLTRAELRELLPSTSEMMEGIVNYRNISHCYDVFDRKKLLLD
ncbi:MAG: hypothetical protein JRS35_22385 [Deltaproteobacteria bacterium]|nr:hypothetical protein [Deltaproteobacteria bacterium]